jgi:DNA-binding MarR family transcriptional regulator
MALEQEIQQSSFASEQAKLIVNLIYSYNILKGRIMDELKEYGLTMQQYNVLRIVKGAGSEGVTTSEIRDRMLDKMSDASRMVDRLVAMELLEKNRYKEDRRLFHIELTNRGNDIITSLVQESLIEQIAWDFPNKNAQQLNELLDDFRASIG